MPEYLPGQQLTAVQQSAVRKTGANARVDRSRYDNTRVYRGKDGKTYVETTDKQLVAITTGTAPSTTTESSSQTANTALDTAGAAQNTANAVQQEVTDARTSTQGTCATLKEHLQAVWDALTGHTARTDNPHGVTAEQVGAIPTSDKGVAGGVAILDPQGFLTSAEIPPVAINDIHLVASEAEMLALSAQKGDVAIRTDQNNMTFILRLEPAATLSNWQQIGVAPDMPVVTSVNGQTGVVVIDDVDTVDGKHAAQFLQCNSNASAIQVNGIDLNTLMSAGLYWATSCLNRPLEVSGSVIVIPRDSSYLTQLYMTYANQVYCRALSSGTWTMWVNLRDAETVDGKHATDFAPSGYGLGQTSPWIDVDLNTVVKTGFYYAGSNSTNKPVTENGWLLVEAYSNLYAKQIYSTPTGAYYLRTLNNGTWGSWQKIWHAGNDGAGSGLDADMVDGKHATDFAPVGYGLGTMTPYYHDDLNNATTTGFFYAASDATNKPVSHNGWLLVEGLDTNYVKQTYCSYTNEYFLRTRNYGTWSSWQKIWHTGNDGSGSGLDADTCDGQHLSSTDTPTFAGIAQTG
ncbi:MAG TPA: pyocin knob domain-containing protein, partial [Armatimonadota bacterium]|nr:pyocin knob domain-containing protein [Armatimonadota bacterium]